MANVKQAQAPDDLRRVRNIGIIAHIDAGKTTLSERILFYSQRIHRMGEVHDGTATMDFMPEEQERGITIVSACTSCTWEGHRISLIDTPGHVDFTIEVERSLRVLDGAIGVFCAVGGVEPQSETVWRQSEKFAVPKLAFINKIDRVGADFSAVLEAMQERLAVVTLPLSIPLGQGDEFEAIIDLVRMERMDFDEDSRGQDVVRSPLSANEAAYAMPWRERMLETLAEQDDLFVDMYLGGETITVSDIEQAVRRAVIARRLVPVFVGSALRNAGVQPLLDAVCAYLPSPLDTAAITAADGDGNKTIQLEADANAPFAGLVFKIIMEGSRKLALVRIYAGSLAEGDTCLNVGTGQQERAAKLYHMHADSRDAIAVAYAGDIVGVTGLRSARTGDTLTAPNHPLMLEQITSYRPVISLALEAGNADEAEKLDMVLERLTLEDPTLSVELDDATGQRILSGMGELHLDVVMERIHREYGLAPRSGNPQVVYQESVSQVGESAVEFDRMLGEKAHYGHVSVRISPRPRASGNEVRFVFPQEHMPKVWLEAVEQGVEDSLQSGILGGYPVQDVAVEITGMDKREGVSSAPGYHMAAVAAVKEALQHAGSLLLEPIMAVEIAVPEGFVGASIGLLGGRKGRVETIITRGDMQTIRAVAPLRELFGFSTQLRSATQGRAGLVMSFAMFDSVDE